MEHGYLLPVTYASTRAGEVEHSTSEQPLSAQPCGAARCPAPWTTHVDLRLGGQVRPVPFCEDHAARWRAADPYP